MKKQKIVVTGATGFIGSKICLELLKKNYEVHILTRNPKKARKALPFPYTIHEWNYHNEAPKEALEGAYAVFHLAGEPVAQRWNKKIKQEIYDSRIIGTKNLIRAIEKCEQKPEVMIGASAIGVYGDRGNEKLDETSPASGGYLSNVCIDWESAYQSSINRTAIIRIGVVLGLGGGALSKMLPPFRLGAGGPLGLGKQWTSWIHLEDLVNLFLFALENEKVSGILNGVAPIPVTNMGLTKALGKSLARPAFFPVPVPMIKLLFGEMSTILLSSQKVIPEAPLKYGFQYKFAQIDQALDNLLRPQKLVGGYVFEGHQWVPHSLDRTFDFFSEAKNLEKITPSWINFQIKKTSTNNIQEGTLIDYRLKLKGVPFNWRTLIKEWSPKKQFVDVQLKGPYKVWHHTHTFQEIAGGTLMSDRVIYQIPLGMIGDVAGLALVHSDVERIFNYRKQTVAGLI